MLDPRDWLKKRLQNIDPLDESAVGRGRVADAPSRAADLGQIKVAADTSAEEPIQPGNSPSFKMGSRPRWRLADDFLQFLAVSDCPHRPHHDGFSTGKKQPVDDAPGEGDNLTDTEEQAG